jgi:hypothetical protein
VTNSSLKPGETYEFYCSEGPGFKIMNEENYPESIKSFLYDELCYIIKILSKGNYYVLLEIGSANSIKALTIVQKNYKYYGIDINSRFVQEATQSFAEKNISDKAKVKLMSFFELNSSFEAFNINEKVLIVLPFNLFGNLGNPKKSLEKLFILCQDFIISYYKVNLTSYLAREEYYKNCEYKNLIYTKDNSQAKFTSSEGLCSITYSPEYIERIIHELVQELEFPFKIDKIIIILILSDWQLM